jgi:hypothetical protein
MYLLWRVVYFTKTMKNVVDIHYGTVFCLGHLECCSVEILIYQTFILVSTWKVKFVAFFYFEPREKQTD